MMKRNRLFLFCLLTSVFVIFPASAYWDTGTLTVLWQMLAAVVFGIAFTLKIYWIKIKNFFYGKKTE